MLTTAVPLNVRILVAFFIFIFSFGFPIMKFSFNIEVLATFLNPSHRGHRGGKEQGNTKPPQYPKLQEQLPSANSMGKWEKVERPQSLV